MDSDQYEAGDSQPCFPQWTGSGCAQLQRMLIKVETN